MPLYKELSTPTCVNDNRADCVNSNDINATAKFTNISTLLKAL